MAIETNSTFGRWERGAGWLASALVVFGGACLVLACLLTGVSVVGSVTVRPLPGEIELVEALCGLAVFAFLPYCQLKRGHVGVDLVMSAFGGKAMDYAQLAGDLIVAVLFAVLTWRHGVGFLDKYANGETTPLLLLPVWWGFAAAFVLMLANLFICLFVVAADLRALRHGNTIVVSMGSH